MHKREHLLDVAGNIITFETFNEAKEFLLDNGFDDADIDESVFIEETV